MAGLVGWLQNSLSGMFSPGPILPIMTPSGSQLETRTFDYEFTANMDFMPKAAEAKGYTFEHLRKFSSDLDILRIIIENQKDNICKNGWNFKLKMENGEKPDAYKKRNDSDPRIETLKEAFYAPNKIHEFNEWIRMLTEEILVCDAGIVYPRKTFDGSGIYGLDVIDPNTIKILIDDTGRRPTMGPQYQQIIKGLITKNFLPGELHYFIRNPRVNKSYGYSPVEFTIRTIDLAMRRFDSQVNYYTHGNIPPMFLRAPESWDLNRIKAFNVWWRTYWKIHPEALKQGVMIPFGLDPVFTEDEVLKDEFDEWLARIFCFAIGISPTPFIKNMNRSTSESQREQAAEEGSSVIRNFVARIVNRLIREVWGWKDVEFVWLVERPADSEKQAKVDEIYVKNAIKSVDEVRGELGLHPIGIGHMMVLNNGAIAFTEEGLDFKPIVLETQENKNDPKAVAPKKSESKGS